MPVIMVRRRLGDTHLWDGTLDRLRYYIEKVWLTEGSELDPVVLDFSRCRVGPNVARYIMQLMADGVNCINSKDLPGMSEIYSDLKEATKNLEKYRYVPIDIQIDYADIVDNAKKIKQLTTEYNPAEHDGKELCFYVRAGDEAMYANTNIVPANMAYYMLTRLSVRFDPFYNGTQDSEKYYGLYNRFVLRNMFMFITTNVGVPPSYYAEGDRSVWIVNTDGLLQKLVYNKDGEKDSYNGINMYYYPGFGWYTLNDLRRMNLMPLPGFLFVESISNKPEFVSSLQKACMKVRPPKVRRSDKKEGSALLKFLEDYRDIPKGDIND